MPGVSLDLELVGFELLKFDFFFFFWRDAFMSSCPGCDLNNVKQNKYYVINIFFTVNG